MYVWKYDWDLVQVVATPFTFILHMTYLTWNEYVQMIRVWRLKGDFVSLNPTHLLTFSRQFLFIFSNINVTMCTKQDICLGCFMVCWVWRRTLIVKTWWRPFKNVSLCAVLQAQVVLDRFFKWQNESKIRYTIVDSFRLMGKNYYIFSFILSCYLLFPSKCVNEWFYHLITICVNISRLKFLSAV